MRYDRFDVTINPEGDKRVHAFVADGDPDVPLWEREIDRVIVAGVGILPFAGPDTHGRLVRFNVSPGTNVEVSFRDPDHENGDTILHIYPDTGGLSVTTPDFG